MSTAYFTGEKLTETHLLDGEKLAEVQCDSCYFVTSELFYVRNWKMEPGAAYGFWVCDLCFSGQASSPQSHEDIIVLTRELNRGLNIIRRDILQRLDRQ